MSESILEQVLRTASQPLWPVPDYSNPLNMEQAIAEMKAMIEHRKGEVVRVWIPMISCATSPSRTITQPIICWADERVQDQTDYPTLECEGLAVSESHARWLVQHPKELARRRKEKPATPAAGHTTHASEAST